MDSDSDETIILETDNDEDDDDVEPMQVDEHRELPELQILVPTIDLNLLNPNNFNHENIPEVLQIENPSQLEIPSDSRSNSPSLLSINQAQVVENDELKREEEEETTQNKECSPTKKRKEYVDDDNGQTCPICLDSWTNVGEHRICALKCGHLFGASCLLQWFSTQKKKTCPTCKKKSAKSELRYIYAKKLVAMDVSELEEIKLQLDTVTEEKNRIQVELTKSICREHLIVQQMEDLKRRVASLDSLVDKVQRSGPFGAHKITMFMDKSLEISREGGCRVLDYCDNLGLMVASMQSSTNLFRGFGVRKIDVSTYRPTAFIPLHKLSIRDLHFHSQNPWLLSVSFDKTFKIVDANTCTPISVYTNGDVPLWSCCWDINDSNMFFVGKQQGSIAKFDVRHIQEPICTLEVPGDMSPVVSVAPIDVSPGDAIPNGGIITCKLNSLWVFENTEPESNECNRYPLAIEGPFISMAFKNRQLLVSTRSNSRYPYSRQHLCNIEAGSSNNLLCSTTHCFPGSCTQKYMSRSCLVSYKSDTYVAAHHEANRSVLLWSTKTGGKGASIPAHEPVLDLRGVNTGNANLLAALTEKKLEFFKFV